ncbi:hypothetical protein Hdeb2414_s0167g00820831 [Helianthus debilis subsp. tardiflorus]
MEIEKREREPSVVVATGDPRLGPAVLDSARRSSYLSDRILSDSVLVRGSHGPGSCTDDTG